MRQNFPITSSYGVEADLRRLDEAHAPGQQSDTVHARGLIVQLGQGVLRGGPLPTFGNQSLEGTRWMTFPTPSSRAQGHGYAAMAYQLHPARPADGAAAVIQVIAVGRINNDADQRRFDEAVLHRLNPAGGQFPLAYSNGVIGHDIQGLMADPAEGNAIFTALQKSLGDIGNLYRDDVLGGVTTSDLAGARDAGANALKHRSNVIVSAQDLVGYRNATFAVPAAAGRERTLSAIYRVLPPAAGSKVNVVHIAAVGEPDSAKSRILTAVRLKRQHPDVLKAAENYTEPSAQHRRPANPAAAAATARSTTGRGPTPRGETAAAAPAKPRKPTKAERARKTNGL